MSFCTISTRRLRLMRSPVSYLTMPLSLGFSWAAIFHL